MPELDIDISNCVLMNSPNTEVGDLEAPDIEAFFDLEGFYEDRSPIDEIVTPRPNPSSKLQSPVRAGSPDEFFNSRDPLSPAGLAEQPTWEPPDQLLAISNPKLTLSISNEDWAVKNECSQAGTRYQKVPRVRLPSEPPKDSPPPLKKRRSTRRAAIACNNRIGGIFRKEQCQLTANQKFCYLSGHILDLVDTQQKINDIFDNLMNRITSGQIGLSDLDTVYS